MGWGRVGLGEGLGIAVGTGVFVGGELGAAPPVDVDGVQPLTRARSATPIRKLLDVCTPSP
jgi:hypothetical protein